MIKEQLKDFYKVRPQYKDDWPSVYYMQEVNKNPFVRFTKIEPDTLSGEGKQHGECDWRRAEAAIRLQYPDSEFVTLVDFFDEATNVCYDEKVIVFPLGDTSLMVRFDVYHVTHNVKQDYVTDQDHLQLVSDVEVLSVLEGGAHRDFCSELGRIFDACFVKSRSKAQVGLITASHMGYDISYHSINEPLIDSLDMYYGEGFEEGVHNRMVAHIKNKESGLVILRGQPGTGKTSYIKYLMANLGDEHSFILIPPEMIARMTAADMVEFIIEHCQESTFVIEDGEKALLDRAASPESASLVSSILNMSDGMMADIVKARFICTINKDDEQMDDALFREGRMLMEYEFEPLDAHNANVLAEHIGLEHRFEGSATLAEIFNWGKQLKRKRPDKKRIGF